MLASSLKIFNWMDYFADHSKSSQGYSEDKYYMVRPASHGPVHPNVIPIHQAPQVKYNPCGVILIFFRLHTTRYLPF